MKKHNEIFPTLFLPSYFKKFSFIILPVSNTFLMHDFIFPSRKSTSASSFLPNLRGDYYCTFYVFSFSISDKRTYKKLNLSPAKDF